MTVNHLRNYTTGTVHIKYTTFCILGRASGLPFLLNVELNSNDKTCSYFALQLPRTTRFEVRTKWAPAY